MVVEDKVISALKLRRMVLTAFLTVGLISLLIFFLAFKGLYQFPFIQGNNIWLVGAFGFTCIFSLSAWRCPHCKAHLGQLSARICSSCGFSLIYSRQINSGQIGITDVAKTKSEFKKATDKLVIVNQYEEIWTKIIYTFVPVFFAIVYLADGVPKELVVVIVLLAVIHYLKNLYLYYLWQKIWRCPGCKSLLPLASRIAPDVNINICSSCGIELV